MMNTTEQTIFFKLDNLKNQWPTNMSSPTVIRVKVTKYNLHYYAKIALNIALGGSGWGDEWGENK